MRVCKNIYKEKGARKMMGYAWTCKKTQKKTNKQKTPKSRNHSLVYDIKSKKRL